MLLQTSLLHISNNIRGSGSCPDTLIGVCARDSNSAHHYYVPTPWPPLVEEDKRDVALKFTHLFQNVRDFGLILRHTHLTLKLTSN